MPKLLTVDRPNLTLCPLIAWVLGLAYFMFVQVSHADSQASQADTDKLARATLDYTGWAVIKKQVLDSQAPDDEWISMRNLLITDDGKKLRLLDGDSATPYQLELIVITYQETNTTVLKLALYEDGKDKAITYIWGQPGAERLGMNLRWMQAGFTKASGAP